MEYNTVEGSSACYRMAFLLTGYPFHDDTTFKSSLSVDQGEGESQTILPQFFPSSLVFEELQRSL